MAIATWKDLCVDAVDAHLIGQFWAAAVGLDYKALPDGDAHLTGPTEQHGIWINSVAETVTVKQRVHLDLHAGAVGDVLALGATPEDIENFRWKILRDPEGGELCVFERSEVPDYRLYEIGVDSAEPQSIARWWADVLGATYGANLEEGWSWAEQIPGAPFDCLVFAAVPEPKTVKNRIHWDVDTVDLSLLTDAGATVLQTQPRWTVLADPEGNEFCAFLSD